MVGSHLSIQGQFVRRLPDGRLVVRVDDHTFVGRAVATDEEKAARGAALQNAEANLSVAGA